MRKHWHCW